MNLVFYINKIDIKIKIDNNSFLNIFYIFIISYLFKNKLKKFNLIKYLFIS